MELRASEMGIAAYLTIAEDLEVPIENISFYAATISPAVANAAIAHPLRDSWILDSGLNINVANDRSRFETFHQADRLIGLGKGSVLAVGFGRAKIRLTNKAGKSCWAILPEVWYAPDFQTNLVSVSDIAKRGFFFNR